MLETSWLITRPQSPKRIGTSRDCMHGYWWKLISTKGGCVEKPWMGISLTLPSLTKHLRGGLSPLCVVNCLSLNHTDQECPTSLRLHGPRYTEDWWVWCHHTQVSHCTTTFLVRRSTVHRFIRRCVSFSITPTTSQCVTTRIIFGSSVGRHIHSYFAIRRWESVANHASRISQKCSWPDCIVSIHVYLLVTPPIRHDR